MCKQSRLRECLSIVFYYEFNTGYFGLETSEFTDEIVKCEVNRLARHRNDIEDGKVYTFKKCKRNYCLKAYDCVEDAVQSFKDTWDNVYVITDNCISLLSVFCGCVEMDTIHTF